MGLEILRASPLCTLQDLGRHGASLLGVSQSGAADEYAYLVANMLLQNPANAPMLEIAYGNMAFKATKDLNLVVTGAKTSVKVSGQSVPMWHTFRIQKGQTLLIEMASLGQWVYLGIKGEIEANKLFESASTSVREKLGGKQYKSGDLIYVKEQILSCNTALKPKLIPDYSTPLTLRVVLGYQAKHFTKVYTRTFFDNEYTITPQSNRMGYRLDGPPIGYEGRFWRSTNPTTRPTNRAFKRASKYRWISKNWLCFRNRLLRLIPTPLRN